MKPTNSSNQQSPILFIILIPLLLLALWAVQNPDVALPLMERPILILPYLVKQFGLLKMVAFTGVTTFCFLFLLINPHGHQNSNVQRGAQVVSARRLKALLKKQPRYKNQPQLTIAEMPIPAEYETLGFFMFGSPGSGKTQAINQMVEVLKQRTNFRGIVFDRNGEMLEKFYDPQRDLIFNPFDARSVHWSHVHEAASPETMAAALIPQESTTKEPFFSNASRAVMAELFRQTKSNQELWSLEKLVLVDLPGNVEEAFNHWLTASDILEAAKDLGVEIQNWYVLDDSTECYEGFLRTLEFVQDNATHILVRNFGRCEDWDGFDSVITSELIAEYQLQVIDLPKLRFDTATTIYKNALSFTEARRYSEFSTAQLAGLRGYMRRVYSVLETAGFNVESLKVSE